MRATTSPAKRPVTYACDLCGHEPMIDHACKLRCPRCGYTRDCSDP
jgi:DNA-directed RNA polymerase subunit RPC12/RpoP